MYPGIELTINIEKFITNMSHLLLLCLSDIGLHFISKPETAASTDYHQHLLVSRLKNTHVLFGFRGIT
jgi:hypothetical protein